ncbi:glycosyltransferase [Qipengyuania sediminis]|uniref:glycosyltransferase n=1 Tax=Qipengyuania sediminis TaxID=1532023 RepID=UPI001405339B|nr:glycosyltransferase [Qipengyuania sediminis]
MRVAVVAHIRHPIAPPFMGGMEAHAFELCRALAEARHEPVLFAAAGSTVPGIAVEAITDAPYEAVLPWAQWRATPELAAIQRSSFARAWDMIRDDSFDIVHNNTLFAPLIDWARRDGVAMLTSLHVPPFGELREAVAGAVATPWLHFTVPSHSQLGFWDGETHPGLSVVHNAVDAAMWRPSDLPVADRGLVWSGRITPTKGTALALRAAHGARVPLALAGSIDDETYFAHEVEPLLDDRRRYLGHLEGEELARFIAGGRALVMTPTWPEPFGLVAAEALSCDIPVIAFDEGAMREIIGDAGTIVPAGDVAALGAAMADPPRLPPGSARQRAERLFGAPTMIAGYEALYRRAIAARTPARIPTSSSNRLRK